MKVKKTLSKALLIICMVFLITGCSSADISNIKRNGSAVQEYNKAIEIYNKLAISFSDLVRTMKKEAENPMAFDDKFWETYKEKETKVLKNIDTMLGFQYKHKEIEKVKGSIDSLINDIENYINKIEDFRIKQHETDWNDFEKDSQLLYDEILNKSSEITVVFNKIYDDYITSEKK